MNAGAAAGRTVDHDTALARVVFRAEVFRGLDALAAVGGLDALSQPAELDRLKTFLGWALPSTVLSSVVAAELTAGARTPKALDALNDALLACQAREHGWTIVTRDADFGALRRSISGLKVAAPFPARP